MLGILYLTDNKSETTEKSKIVLYSKNKEL